MDQALDRVRAWLAQPASILVEPTARHPEVLGGLLATLGTGGNLTNGAHLGQRLRPLHWPPLVRTPPVSGIACYSEPSWGRAPKKGPLIQQISVNGCRYLLQASETCE